MRFFFSALRVKFRAYRWCSPPRIGCARSAAFSASSRRFDLNGETNRVRKKHNRAVIAGDVRRFGHVINKDGVLGTHRQTSSLPYQPQLGDGMTGPWSVIGWALLAQ